ncbi:MAG TPA: hypothetical protein VGP76_22290 [Planctomycetaceae bacterium]|nr:hypothetical protein [Planctomycetaceae bacterium]
MRRFTRVLLMLMLWSLPVVAAIGGGAYIHFDAKWRQQARIDAANTEVREAVKGADGWLKQGIAKEGEHVEHRLMQAIAANDVSEKANADAVLERVRTRRAELAADTIYDSAKTKLDAKAIVEALALLRRYVADGHATKKPEAKQLLADCDVATSESAAVNALVAMSDERFAQFKNTGKLDDGKVAYSFLVEMRAAAFRRSLEAAGRRREENKIAEAKRQEIADAAKKQAADDLAKSSSGVQDRSVRERMVGIWRWGSGENEMKFAPDGTFLERCSWGVVSQGRWSFDRGDLSRVQGHIQLSYDNKYVARVAPSGIEDRIFIDVKSPYPVPWQSMVGSKIQGNRSWWDPPPAEIVRAKMVGIWRWGPGESEVKFAQDGTFLERNSWGVASQGLWRIDKERYDLLLRSSLSTVRGIPDEGKKLIIVAAVKDVLHFRIFDSVGMPTVDTDEKRLAEHAGPIENLRKQLGGLWPPHELTESEKDRVITAVTSIVGYDDKGANDDTVRLAYDNKCSAIVRVNVNDDKIFIEPINQHGWHGDRMERNKIQGNAIWWNDESELIREKLVDEWRWGENLDFSITFAQDGTFVDRHPWGMELRGHWSVEKDGTIQLSATNKLPHYSIFMSPVARMNLKEDKLSVGHNTGRPGSDSYAVASRYREKPITEADIPGVWAHSPGAFFVMIREITLLPNGKIDDPAGGNSWTLNGKTLVLRWADPRAPGGFWVDACTVRRGPKGQRFNYSGVNQQKLKIAGSSGKLEPWFEKARQEAPAGAWEECKAVPEFFWSEKWRQLARATIAHRNAVGAEVRARRAEEERLWIEEAGRRAAKIWNAPGKYTPDPKPPYNGPRQSYDPMKGQTPQRPNG